MVDKKEQDVFGLTSQQKEAVLKEMGKNPNQVFFTWQGLQVLMGLFPPNTPMEQIIKLLKQDKQPKA